MELWNKFKTPPAEVTKNFTRSGGFSGTAIDPMWLIESATKEWGPMGYRWGIEPNSITEEYITLCHDTVLHICRFTLYYPIEDGCGRVPCVGQTFAVAEFTNKVTGEKYLKADEEAPKKSTTDGLSKGLSWLGFASDVYMGKFDGNKWTDPKTQVKKAEFKAGIHKVKPTSTKVVKETSSWTLYAIMCADGEFVTFSPDVANACHTASEEKKELEIRFVEKKGKVNADSIVS